MSQKFCVTLVIAALIALIASPVLAEIIPAGTQQLLIGVRALDGAGYTVTDDGKTVTMDEGTSPVSVGLRVYAILSGSNATLTDDALQTIYGGIRRTYDTVNNPAGINCVIDMASSDTTPYTAPFDASATAISVTSAMVGNAAPAAYATGGYFIARSLAMQYNSTDDQVWDLGDVQMIVTCQGTGVGDVADATINYVKPLQNTATATFRVDNTGKTGATGYALIVAGTPITVKCVPEPSTLIMLGMGCLALLAYRRRK